MARKATKKSSKKATKETETKTSKSPRLMINPDIEEVKEFRDLLPPLPSDVRKALEESIRTEGLRDPLVGWRENGTLVLVDGYNRLKFCKKHKRPYRVIVKSFNNREDVKQWMWENQESRRNMTPYQRIEVVLKFKDIVAEQAKKNQQAAGGAVSEKFNKAKLRKKLKQIRTNEVLGKRAGVSYAQVGKVRSIQEKIAEGVISKEVLEELREGKVSINRIYNRYCDGQSSTKQARPIPKIKHQPAQNIAERSNRFFEFLEEYVSDSFSLTEDRNYIYEKVSEWVSVKRAEVSSQQE